MLEVQSDDRLELRLDLEDSIPSLSAEALLSRPLSSTRDLLSLERESALCV